MTSPVTLAECMVVPRAKASGDLHAVFTQLIVDRSVFVSIGQEVATVAAQLRSAYNLNLLDAFQIAAALASGCQAFLTNDKRLSRVPDLRVIVVDELENSPA